MKKNLFMILGLLTLGTSVFAKDNIVEFKTGLSPAPRYDVTPSKKAKFSYEIGVEYRYLVTENTELGAGIAYQSHGKLKGFTDVEDKNLKVGVEPLKLYDSVPLYLTGKYNFNLDSEVKPYVKADLGYSFNRAKKLTGTDFDKMTNTTEDFSEKIKFKNGLYASVGVGLEYRNFVTELAYVHTTAKIKWDDEDGSDTERYNNNALRLTVGYKFNF